MRPTAEKRHLDYIKAIRKRRIDHEVDPNFPDWYNNLHQYSKNKIHCSCPMCSQKTNNRGRKGSWEPPISWSATDRRKLDELEYQEDEELTLE